jgi:hypothetical protein
LKHTKIVFLRLEKGGSDKHSSLVWYTISHGH